MEYLNFELYVVLVKESSTTILMALGAVFLVVLAITANLRMTAIVLFVVSLVNVYMVGTAYYLGLYMNTILSLNMSFALGVAVDFSTHIAHMYLTVKAPEHL